MRYCLSKRIIGLTAKPEGEWKGSKDEGNFKIKGYSYSDNAKEIERRDSVSGNGVFLNKPPVCVERKMQESVTLSVT